LRRRAAKAVAKEEELVVPISAPAAEVATTIVDLLQELIPAVAEPALASAAP
jgi:hypothetical protein